MRKKRYKFDHGLPFSEIVGENLDLWIERVDSDKPVLLVVDGGLGEGKTRLGIHLADYINLRLQKSLIDFDIQYGMGGVEFQEKFMMCIEKKRKVIIYDEAGDFTKKGAMTKFNKSLNRVFQTYRKFKIMVICILPLFFILDKGIYDGCIVRGLFHCYNRTPMYGNIKAYDLDSMFYMQDLMARKRVYNPFKVFNRNLTNPNFDAHYLDITPQRAEIFDKLDTEGKTKILNSNILASRGLVTMAQVGEKLDRTASWVGMKLRELKIKHEYQHKKKKYYEGSIIERLREEVGYRKNKD